MVVEQFAGGDPGEDVAEGDGVFEDVERRVEQCEGLIQAWSGEWVAGGAGVLGAIG